MATQSTQKTDLLDRAIAAHGGAERWQEIGTMSARITVGGALLALKGRPEGLGGAVLAHAETSAPRLTFTPFPGGIRGAYESDRVELTRADGKAEAIEDVRATFSELEFGDPWDDFHLLYFTGYAIWNYLMTPFLLAWPGFEVEEIESWQEDGEKWRRLRAVFPDGVPSHCSEQTFYFDEEGLLRRLDYAPEVVSPKSPIPAAHYCYDHKKFSGLVVPTRRRVFTRGDDGSPATDQLVVELDVDEVELS